MDTHFESPQDAEDAFYDAFETANLAAMSAAWANDDDNVCVHPGSPVLHGREAIQESWKHIFASDSRMSFTIHHIQWVQQSDLAVHILEEEISTAESGGPVAPPIPVTNVYRRTPQGWRIILHHASAPPAGTNETASSTRETVH